MAERADNLILDHLRAIRSEIGEVKAMQADYTQQVLSLRQQVHALEGTALRVEANLARLDLRVDRIERRLDLVEA